ncbi:MAG: PAS domain S-box protein [Caldimonas sp.]
MRPNGLTGLAPSNDASPPPQAEQRAVPPGPRGAVGPRTHADRMAALVQVQRLLASSEATLEALMDRIPDLTLSVVPASGAVFELCDGDEIVIRSASASAAALAANSLWTRLAMRGSLSGEAIRLGHILRCDDSELDSRVGLEACRESGLRSMIVTVVRDKSGPIGALKVFDFEPGHFDAADADSLELVAEALGAAIQRKRADESVQRSLRNLAGIVRLQQQVASSDVGLQAALDMIVEGAQELTGADGASIACVEGADLVGRAARGIADERARFRLEGSLAGLSIARGEILCCDDSETDTRVNRDACRRMGVRSLLGAPLGTGHGVAGVLRVLSGRVHAFSPADVGTLQILAEWLGVVMERAAVTEQLRDSESQYRLLFAAHPLPMWVHDVDTLRFLAVNDSAIANYGYSKEEFLAMTLRELRSPEGVALPDRYLACRPPAGATVATWEHRRKDGSLIDVEASESTILFGGRPARLVLAQDVTERKRAERRIERSEALLNIGGRAARLGGWSMDLPDRRFTQSDEACVIFDMPPGTRSTMEEAIDRYLPESRTRLRAAVARAHQFGTPYDLELEAVTARGRHIWVRTIGQEVRDSTGALVGAGGAVQDISEKKQSEEKLGELAASLTTTLESISDGFYTLDREWRFTYVNTEALRMMQRPRDDLMGRVIWEAIPRLLGTGFERQYRDAVERNCAISVESYYAPWEQWLEVHAYPSEAGLTVSFRDVSERHIAQQALHELNETLEAKVVARTAELELANGVLAGKEEEIRSVVEHMADGVITFGDDGIVRSANPEVEAIFGHRAPELVGRHVSLLIPALSGLVPARSGGRDAPSVIAGVGRESVASHRLGDTLALDVAFSDYRIRGERVWTAILRDIGERVRIMADLEQARNGAEEASRAKSAFVATMSHEIRTPMNGVIGMIDVLHLTELAPEQARILGVARESAHSLLAIIEDILDFSKIEAGRVELERLPLSVAGVVDKVCELVRGMAVGKGVALVAETDPGLPAAVWGDAARLRQVLVNLLSNAIKFSAGRSAARVTMRVRTSERSADRVNLQLEVEDNGVGMDAATVKRLFVPFAQADVSTTRRFGGTGLGLAISHHLVELMGGYIELRSTPGVGSVFTVCLPFFVAPVEQLEADAARAAAQDAVRPAWRVLAGAAETPAPEGPPREESRILVAEDNEINQQVITHQLRHLGFRGEVVANGRLALARWRSGHFGMLLTDLQMPEMDGYELTATIRSEEGGRTRMPIIALTANALKEEEVRCKAAGMDGYLTKPVHMARLGETLNRWLRPGAAVTAPTPTREASQR